MRQFFSVSNNKGYSLDLFFSTLSDISAFAAPDILTIVDDHHIPFVFKVPLSLYESHSKLTQKNEQYYDQINTHLSNVNWGSTFDDNKNVESNLQFFHETLSRPIDEFVPMKTFHSKNDSYPRWYTSELIYLIIDKKLQHLKSKQLKHTNREKSDRHYIESKRLRAKYIRLSRICYKEYIDKVEGNLSQNSKFFWSYVNKLKNSSCVPNNI
ncbi:hypothetical protein QAD02_002206 [Eretmocerus hayati]|uniref:Uncharacterized protein n=1 Tax=Eretmocerus hayati TaxID=131215 RepID=A0ACC2NL47_9HYME|nr:hypothetical protein QAD02_002206 [Eretmocerus hayati]